MTTGEFSRTAKAKPVLVKRPSLTSIDDGEGKPINIHLHPDTRDVRQSLSASMAGGT
ncbi:hypothetical protein [Myxococcus qinghaiensis]|uniref:hypothetical protein n=1 Tax=Myxococcus qinghaiensis TaxID=2906758 RepID=UPI0020A7E9FF|nr:hypothetical protein [Myxococcus qinghaiensis]MCP3161863.1 hypothetical protein [Myxococcus qinghaiensis]